MQIFYYIIFIFSLVIIFLVIRYLILGRKNLPSELFSEALRNENSGNYEEAVIAYENALKEVEKIRFPSNTLRKSIIQKLKVLNTAIDYQNSFQNRS